MRGNSRLGQIRRKGVGEKRNLESRGGQTRAEGQDGGRSKSSTQTVYNKRNKKAKICCSGDRGGNLP